MRPEKNWIEPYISLKEGLAPDLQRRGAPKSQLENLLYVILFILKKFIEGAIKVDYAEQSDLWQRHG